MTAPNANIRCAARSMWKWVGHIITCACLLGYSQVYAADSTFLLQLGTFPTEAAAVKKWDDVKAKNGDVVGSLTLHVAEVVIPPDNNINYRTQAGPIPTHAQAASLCASLQSRSIDCNIVETALFTEAAPTTPSANSAVSATIAAEAAPVVTDNATSASVSPVIQSEATAPPPAKTHWWNSLFSSKSSATQPAPAAPVTVTTAPLTPATGEPVAVTVTPAALPEVVATAPVATQPVTPAPVSAFSPPATPSPSMETASMETASVTAPSVAPADRVIPGREQKFLDAEPLPTPSPPTIMSENIAPPASPSNVSNIGKVNVAEAIHVPLSDTNKKRSFNIVAGLPSVSGKGGTPSSLSAKLLWAQISYFSSDDEARHFYSDLTTAYPQFADDTRVRITHPYSARNNTKVSLRMGPFANVSDIHSVCAAARTSSDTTLHCSLVRDLSNSAAAHVTRERPNLGTNYENRTLNYEATNDGPAPMEVASSGGEKSWVQFGSFATPDMAWDSWKALKENHKKLLKKVQATVTTPVSSSASRTLFRLRAGPFSSEMAANLLCDKLSAEGEGCIVLNDY